MLASITLALTRYLERHVLSGAIERYNIVRRRCYFPNRSWGDEALDEVVVCTADAVHIEGVKRLADANREVFSFITQAAFKDAWREKALLVALVDGQVAGFVRYHHRQRDAQTTLYDICVEDVLRGKGIGSKMIQQLKEECQARGRSMIGLKCPVGLRANTFYAEQGFALVATLTGKRQPINVWRYALACETRG